jgi:hypothetical protein
MDVCLKIIKNDKDFFDQSLDEIKLLKFVNKHDPADAHHILRLYDFFYYQVLIWEINSIKIVCLLLHHTFLQLEEINFCKQGNHYIHYHVPES